MLWYFRYPVSCSGPFDEQRSRCKGMYKSKIKNFEMYDIYFILHTFYQTVFFSYFLISFFLLFILLTLSGNMTQYITALN